MNYLLEIVIFNVVIFTISGIIMAKKGKLGMIPKGDTGPMQRAWIDSGKLRETYKESNDRKTGTFYRIHIFADGIGVLYRRCTHVL